MAFAKGRSEEHTSELQSRQYLVCRLLLEKRTRASRVNRRGAKSERMRRVLLVIVRLDVGALDCGMQAHLAVAVVVVFVFNDTATTEIYTLSLHDALPISTLFHMTIAVLLICVIVRSRKRITEKC